MLNVASLIGCAACVSITGLKSLQIVLTVIVAWHITSSSYSVTLRGSSHLILIVSSVLKVVLLLLMCSL